MRMTTPGTQGHDALDARMLPRPAGPQLPDVIDAVGSNRFAPQMLAFLHAVCGAEHCAVFQLGENSLREIAAESLDGSLEAHGQVALYLDQEYWRMDPAIAKVREHAPSGEAMLIQVDTAKLAEHFRGVIYPCVKKRIVISGRREGMLLALSILFTRCNDMPGNRATPHLIEIGDLLLSVIAQHASIMLRRPNLALALASLPEIEQCLTGMTDLPRREAEVCARILYGMSSLGIALELGISEGSVKTYRKRAYERLRIGSERELLKKYLSLWGDFLPNGAHGKDAASLATWKVKQS